MTANEQALEQIKTYLATLPPPVRAKLMRGIEAQQQDGAPEPALAIILNLVKDVSRDEIQEAKRDGTLVPSFRAVFEPFVFEDHGSAKHRGFIRHKSLDAVWNWLLRETEIGDGLAKANSKAATALLDGDETKAAEIVASMQSDIMPVLKEAIESAAADQRKHMKLAMQLEGARYFEDLPDILAVLRLSKRLGKFAGKLPITIPKLNADLAGSILRSLKDRDEDLIYLLLVVYRRLSVPAHIVRILTQYEGSDDGARLSRSRYACCVEIMLAEMDHAASKIAAHIGRPKEFDHLLGAIRRFYGLANGLSVAVDVDNAPDWRKRLADLRRRASEALSGQVETIPGAVRRAMRPRRREAERRVPTPESDVVEAEYAVRLMMALKPYRGELAVNELLATVVGQIENYVEVANGAILDDLRKATGDAHAISKRDLDVAVRINAIVFGDNYAALLKKSGTNASPLPNPYDPGDDEDEDEASEAERAPAA